MSISTHASLSFLTYFFLYFIPGLAYETGKDYSKYLVNVPEKNKVKVLEALQFAHDFCSTTSDKPSIDIPEEWKTAYDMRPWTEFPMQK